MCPENRRQDRELCGSSQPTVHRPPDRKLRHAHAAETDRAYGQLGMTQTDPRRPLDCVGQVIIVVAHSSSPLMGRLSLVAENVFAALHPPWRGSLRSRTET